MVRDSREGLFSFQLGSFVQERRCPTIATLMAWPRPLPTLA